MRTRHTIGAHVHALPGNYWYPPGIEDWTLLSSSTSYQKFDMEIWRIVQTRNLMHFLCATIMLITFSSKLCKIYGFDWDLPFLVHWHDRKPDGLRGITYLSAESTQNWVIWDFSLGVIAWPTMLKEIYHWMNNPFAVPFHLSCSIFTQHHQLFLTKVKHEFSHPCTPWMTTYLNPSPTHLLWDAFLSSYRQSRHMYCACNLTLQADLHSLIGFNWTQLHIALQAYNQYAQCASTGGFFITEGLYSNPISKCSDLWLQRLYSGILFLYS